MTFKSTGRQKQQPAVESSQHNTQHNPPQTAAIHNAAHVLGLQNRIGNQATKRLIQRGASPPKISQAPAPFIQTFRDIAETIDVDLVSINTNFKGNVVEKKNRHTNPDSGLFPHGLGIEGFEPSVVVKGKARSTVDSESNDWTVGFVQYVSTVDRRSLYRSDDKQAEYYRVVTLPDPPWFDGDANANMPWYSAADAVDLPMDGSSVTVKMEDDPFLSFNYKIVLGNTVLRLVEIKGHDAFSTWVTAFNHKTQETVDLYHIGWLVDYRAIYNNEKLEVLGKGEITNAGQGVGSRPFKYTKTAKNSSFNTKIESKGLSDDVVNDSKKENRATGAWTSMPSTSGSTSGNANQPPRMFLGGGRNSGNKPGFSIGSNKKIDQ